MRDISATMAQQSIWLVLLLSLLAPQVSSICYYPDGTVTPADVPCLPGDEPSWCCGYGYACLSNRICMVTSKTPNATNTYVRGSCTDESWRSGNCPSFCVNPEAPWKDFMSGGEGMALCPGTQNTYYCVDFNTDAVNCAALENIAVQAPGSPTVLTTIGFDSTGTITSRNPTQTSVRSVGTDSSTGSLNRTSASDSQTPSTGTIAGATVGAVVGVVVLTVGIILIRRRRKKKAVGGDNNQPSWLAGVQPHYESGQGFAKHQETVHEAYALPPELDGGARLSELSTGTPTIERPNMQNWHSVESSMQEQDS